MARFIVKVISLLDLSPIYAKYANEGGEAYAPELLLGLLFYAYATGVFSSRKIEKATYESIPFCFLAGGWHPDHDTIANFRKTFLREIEDLFVQVLVIAHEMGVLKLGNISVDGSKVHADASKSHAVSYGRLLQLEQRLRAEVEEPMVVGEKVDAGDLPEGLDVGLEISLRQKQLLNLEKAKVVLEARAQEGDEAEKPSMKPSCESGKRKPRRQDASREAKAPSRPQQGLGRKTSTTTPIRTRGS